MVWIYCERAAFGSAAAVSFYSCLPGVIASLACRYLKISCVERYDGIGIVAPRPPVTTALRASVEFNDLLLIILKERISEAGATLEFPGSSLSAKRVEKPLKTAGDMRQAAAAPLASLRNIAGRLHFAQTAVIGLCVRASLKPIYELKVEGAGPLSEWARKSSGWRAGTLPAVAPRLMTDSKKSLAIQGRPVPILLGGKGRERPHELSDQTNKLYITGLYAAAASIFRLRETLWGQKSQFVCG